MKSEKEIREILTAAIEKQQAHHDYMDSLGILDISHIDYLANVAGAASHVTYQSGFITAIKLILDEAEQNEGIEQGGEIEQNEWAEQDDGSEYQRIRVGLPVSLLKRAQHRADKLYDGDLNRFLTDGLIEWVQHTPDEKIP